MSKLGALNLGRGGEDGARICSRCWTSDVLEMFELRCIRDVDFGGVTDPGILAWAIAY